MAKQTFTTGQVLTAAQMTSLQQTAMGGGSATAKTASYVLVAADAGTTVAMDAAGATTITVNTALFAAGDTVFIQNLGAGACTVTAGTATVSTAGSLILPQYDAGILYFTSASTAIFYDYIQVGAASPLTTKGDLYTYGTSDARLGVGANGTILTADSAEATGLKWAAAGGGGGGKVLQVVQGTTTTAVTNATTTMTDTGLTVTITPSLATSKVLIIATQNWFQNQNDSISIAQQFAFRVLRGGTEIFDAHGTANRAFGIERPVRTSTMYLWGYANFSVLDSPATTSATTYKLQGRNTNAAGTLVTQNESCQSTIIALEIGA